VLDILAFAPYVIAQTILDYQDETAETARPGRLSHACSRSFRAAATRRSLISARSDKAGGEDSDLHEIPRAVLS
jgi:hypothetical protein